MAVVLYLPCDMLCTGDKPYACDQCNYRAITKENLKRHIEKEHAMMHYVCSQCSFEASNRTQLWVHQQKHKLESVTTCQICQAKFERCVSLQ